MMLWMVKLVMPYFLNKYMDGINNDEFFDYFGIDPIVWTVPHQPDESKGEYYDPEQGEPGFLESRRILTDQWQIEGKELEDPQYTVHRYKFITPEDTLTMTVKADEKSAMVTEHLIKNKEDINILGMGP